MTVQNPSDGDTASRYSTLSRMPSNGPPSNLTTAAVLSGNRIAPVVNHSVAVTEVHVLAVAGSHCSALAASDHSPHKLTGEESSCPTKLYRARKLLFAVIAFDETDWFRHR